jgi:hypothetical protein
LLAATWLPFAVSDILPPDAEISHAELHLHAAATGGHDWTLPTGIRQRLDLAPLGSPTRDLGESMGFAARLAEPLLTERDAAELVTDAFERMASTLATSIRSPGSTGCASTSVFPSL